MTRPERRNIVSLIAVLGVGLMALLYAVWVQTATVSDNREAIRQQQSVIDQLLARDAASTQELQELRRLVQALQAQVRSLGGTPLTQPPTPAATPQGAGPTAAPRASSPSGAARSPAPQPSRTRSPTPAPSPSRPVSPSPSPRTSVCAGPVCVSTGGTS